MDIVSDTKIAESDNNAEQNIHIAGHRDTINGSGLR
jgi:hypothetical protein